MLVGCETIAENFRQASSCKLLVHYVALLLLELHKLELILVGNYYNFFLNENSDVEIYVVEDSDKDT